MGEDDDCVWSTASGYLQVGEAEAPSDSGDAIGTSVSRDGRTWSAVQLIPDLKNVDVGVLGDTVLLDGEHLVPDPADFVDLGDLVPAQFLSIDGGRTWSPTSGWPSAEIASDGQVVVAVGDGAWVAPLEWSPGMTRAICAEPWCPHGPRSGHAAGWQSPIQWTA